MSCHCHPVGEPWKRCQMTTIVEPFVGVGDRLSATAPMDPLGAAANRSQGSHRRPGFGPSNRCVIFPDSQTGGARISNRRFEMYEYHQALVRIRIGESDRQIANRPA